MNRNVKEGLTIKRILFLNFNPRSKKLIHKGFEQVGMTVAEYVNNYENMDYRLFQNKLDMIICAFRPELIFSYGWWENVEYAPRLYEFLKKKGILHIYWATDDPPCLPKMSLPMGVNSDLLFTTCEECIPIYYAAGVEAHFLLFACCEQFYRKTTPISSLKHDIVLIANNYNVKWNPLYLRYRLKGVEDILEPLLSGRYDVSVWGLWWDKRDRAFNLPSHCNGFIEYEKIPSLYSSCKIALGFQSVNNSTSTLSSRTFDIMGCGAFHLSHYSKALERYFKKGIHLEWSSCAEETIEIANHYLSRDYAREKIALEGQKEVYLNHTYKNRAVEAIEIIKNHL